MRYIILLFHLLLISIGNAQQLAGHVYDKTNQKPIEGANVYLDGTTLGTMTNKEGYFTITAKNKMPNALVFSFIGYETITVEDPFSYDKNFKVLMKEDVIGLEEVVIGSPLFSRKKMLAAFKGQFLGTSRSAASCKILNENDIVLHYDPDNHVLSASAKNPLRIVNNYLDYDIIFDLSDFGVKYNFNTLEPYNVLQSYFLGTTFFKDIAKGKKNAEKRRKQTYMGSSAHLMKTIAEGTWEQEKFELFVHQFKDDPKIYFSISDTIGIKKIKVLEQPKKEIKRVNVLRAPNSPVIVSEGKDGTIWVKEYFNIRYNADKISIMDFVAPEIYVDKSGNFNPVTGVIFGGYIGSLKAGDLLPVDYQVEH